MGPAGRPREARQKITSWTALARLVRQAGRRRRTVVFTNGCFDLLHAGHLTLLQQARRQGDVLIVGINSDTSVRALKGAHRPMLPQRDRALLLAGLECVDYVTVFSERTPQRLIERVRPHVLVKGADWATDQVVGREVVQQRGGRVVRIPLRKGYSTTRLIARIRRHGTPQR